MSTDAPITAGQKALIEAFEFAVISRCHGTPGALERFKAAHAALLAALTAPAAPSDILTPEETAFLAARLRRLFKRFGYSLPIDAVNDAKLIGIAGSCIGSMLTAAASARPLRDALNDAFEQRVQRLLANQDELRKFIRAAEQNADDFISLNRAYSELRAASAPQAVRMPATDADVDAQAAHWHDHELTLAGVDCEFRQLELNAFDAGFRAAEAYHGIVPLAPQEERPTPNKRLEDPNFRDPEPFF